MTDDDDEAWFAARRRPRQRSAQPITWQGWAVCIGYGLSIVAAAFLALISWIAATAIILAATVAFVLVLSQKTRAG